MGLLSFFNRTPASSGATRRSGSTDELTRQARARARQRLIGALVLVVLGVVVLPLLFDKDPRPLSSKTAVEVVGQGRNPAAGQKASGKVIDESSADAGVEVPATKPPASAAAAAKSAASSVEARAEADRETPVVAATPRKPDAPKSSEPDKRDVEKRDAEKRDAEKRDGQAKSKAAAQESARAKDLLEGKDAPAKAAEGTRFVVQIGAFADGAAASEARAKVEKLGIKTYTQQVETSAGKRIRVRIGPYTDRDDAEKTLGRIKAAGLPGAVLTL